MKMKWPNGKAFALSIVDDTDNGTVSNVKPVYDFLYSHGLRTTKTAWAFPPRDRFSGQCLQDEDYRCFIQDLDAKGFEIGFHNAGSGDFSRQETIVALEFFAKCIGKYPRLHVNHADNPDNIYWGHKRFSAAVAMVYRAIRKGYSPEGEIEDSPRFWGDYCKKHIAYIRNRVFSGINTMARDPRMPCRYRHKDQYSNYWFSSSDGANKDVFSRLLAKDHVDRLARDGGCCIVYTHFASGFVDANGQLDAGFQERIEYLAKQDGWFAPTSSILDYMKDHGGSTYTGSMYDTWLDIVWLVQRAGRRLWLRV